MNISIGLAFLAGLASFLSPCVLSLVPAYIGYLGGRTANSIQTDGEFSGKLQTFLHGLAFVIGFSFVFVALGVAVSAIGGLLFGLRGWLTKLGGVVVVLFGLHMTGLLHIPLLDYDLRPQTKLAERRSYLSSALLGVFFSAGWSPCVGPVLGAILTLALNSGQIFRGAYLLSSYSVGLAIPFLVAALGVGWVGDLLRKHQDILHGIEIVMGVLLVVVGLMLFAGTFEQLARFGFFVDFGL